MSLSSTRRAGAIALSLALLLTIGLGGTAPAQAAETSPARAGSSWLAGELTGGLMHYDAFGGYDDYGLSLDAYFALVAADVNDSAQDDIIGAIAANLDSYISGEAFGDAGSTYAGPTAKALVAAQTAGRNATAFGGVDLVERLESVTDDASGEIADVSDFGNFANVLGQAFAVQGLATADSSEASAARDFLLDQQCANGSFRLYFKDPCTADTDATSAAVIALIEARSQGLTGTAGAIDDAVGWLRTTQQGNGSFGGGDPTTSAPNTNSTGLAARALGLAGRTTQAGKAAAWIRKLQVTPGSGPLSGEVGAVARNAEALAAGKADGITEATTDEWRRATTQAVLGLVYAQRSAKTVTITRTTLKPVTRRTTTVQRSVVVPAASQAAPAPKTPTGRLGSYLADRLSGGDHVEVKEDGKAFVDYDLTADSLLALRLLEQQPGIAKRTTAFLLDSDSVDAYAHGAPYEKKARYAEPLAKLVVAGVVSGKGARSKVSTLAGELGGLQGDDGGFDDVGDFADASTDTTRHAVITLALVMSGRDEADAAVERLMKAQCSDGGFPRRMQQQCATGEPAATGWALQALNAVEAADRTSDDLLTDRAAGWDAGRERAITRAVGYLQGVVRVDGSVPDGSGALAPGPSAAAAAGRQAVGLDGRTAARSLAAVQRGDGGFGPKKAKESDLGLSTEVAAGLSAGSWLAIGGSGLAAGVTLPVAMPESGSAQAANGRGGDVRDDDGSLSVSPVLAYSVAGLAGLLALGAVGLAGARVARSGRKPEL